ncbi:glycosyltransferase family 9 protein [Candidatus Desantisbacteria bacterium]|nr:glycosyltransferase family 9 protein [Candidatus Desantisbacteria bacterium]
MKLKMDCRFFRQDKPCIFHKKTGIKCRECNHYYPVAFKILIIKLDAIGDVLRTTSILLPLKAKYPKSHITWITLKPAKDIFLGNDLVDNVLDAQDVNTLARLMIEKFNLVINLDAAWKSSILASIAKAAKKKGYIFHQEGYVVPKNEEEKKWFLMGAFDDVKKANTKTYQYLMLKILGLEDKKHKIILNLLPEEAEFAKKFAQFNNLGNKPVIGLNTGSSSRWPQKQWNEKEVIHFIDILNKNLKVNILLFGGVEERLRNSRIIKKVKSKIIDTGCDNTLRDFFALLSLCDILVTSDTLALHAGCALGKKIIALFGPTSSSEIDLYGKGEKITPGLDCICCYKTSCDKKITCMDIIKAEDVFNAVKKMLPE